MVQAGAEAEAGDAGGPGVSSGAEWRVGGSRPHPAAAAPAHAHARPGQRHPSLVRSRRAGWGGDGSRGAVTCLRTPQPPAPSPTGGRCGCRGRRSLG